MVVMVGVPARVCGRRRGRWGVGGEEGVVEEDGGHAAGSVWGKRVLTADTVAALVGRGARPSRRGSLLRATCPGRGASEGDG